MPPGVVNFFIRPGKNEKYRIAAVYMMHIQEKKKKRGRGDTGTDDQHKKLHNRVLTLFSCAGELSHRHHLTRAANLRGAGGAPPSSKPVPNRIEPLRTKAAKFGRKRNKKTHTERLGHGASPPSQEKGSALRGDTPAAGVGSGGQEVLISPVLGEMLPLRNTTSPSLSSPSFCSPSRAFRTHL